MKAQLIIDKHKQTLVNQGYGVDFQRDLGQRVNQFSMSTNLAVGEKYLAIDGADRDEPFILCGEWTTSMFKITPYGIFAIPEFQFQNTLKILFKSGSAILYKPESLKVLSESRNNKYELHPTIFKGEQCFRIKSIRDIPNVVKAGDWGGYVKSEHNLDVIGLCWIHNDAYVFDDARVSGNAQIEQKSAIIDNAIVKGEAQVRGNSIIRKDSVIEGNAIVDSGRILRSKVFGLAHIKNVELIDSEASDRVVLESPRGNQFTFVKFRDNAKVKDTPKINNSTLSGNADISGNVTIDLSTITGNAKIEGNATIINSKVFDNAYVSGFAEILDGASVYGDAIVNGNAKISSIHAKVSGRTIVSSGEVTYPLNESGLVIDGSLNFKTPVLTDNQRMIADKNKRLGQSKVTISQHLL